MAAEETALDSAEHVMGCDDDKASSTDETETNSDCGSYVYNVNEEIPPQSSSPTTADGTALTGSSTTGVTKHMNKGMFYRRTATPASRLHTAKNAVGLLKEQFESQNVVLGGSNRPQGFGNEKQSVGQLKAMFEQQGLNVSGRLSPSESHSNRTGINRSNMQSDSYVTKDITNITQEPNTNISNEEESPEALRSPGDMPMGSIISPLMSPTENQPAVSRYRPSFLRHLGHLKVTPVDIIPSRLEGLPSDEDIEKLKQELSKHMDKLSVPRPTSAQVPADEDDDRVPIYV